MKHDVSEAKILEAAKTIQEDGVVAFPTETVYGLGANALSDSAVQRIFEIKGRPSKNPIIVHLASIDTINQVAEIEPGSTLESQLKKLTRFWPGPLTVVLPKKPEISNLVSARLNTVGIRIPSHPVAHALLKACNLPIAAPSANISNYVSPTSAEHVQKEIGDKVDIILNGGSCDIGIESTVLSLTEETPKLLRPGAITLEQLKEVLGDIILEEAITPTPQSPGMLKSHYAPKTKTSFKEDIPVTLYPKKVGLITFNKTTDLESEFDYTVVNNLSMDGNLTDVARNLFAALREQDTLELDLIVVDSCSEEGLGRAIMDRLRKATSK